MIARRVLPATVALALSACIPSGGLVSYDGFVDHPRGETPRGRLVTRWSRRLTPDQEGPYLPIERSVPALDPVNDRIFVGASPGALWAFDGAGTAQWTYHAGGAIGSQPLLDPTADEIYVASDDGLLHALRASTGATRWRSEVGGAVGRAPVASADAVFLVTDADLVVALDRATGESLWRYRRDAAEGFYVTEHAGLTLDRDLLITGFTDGVVVALDPRDGSVVWERDTTSDLQTTTDTIRFTDVDTTPIIIDDTVYVASFAGGLYALERSSGSVRWLRDEWTGVTGIAMTRDGRLILASGDHGVVAVRAEDGAQVWRHPIRRGAPVAPVVVGDMVFVAESEGGFVALSTALGSEVGRIEDGHGFGASSSAASGRGAVVSNTGKVFVFDVRGVGGR